MFVGIGMIALCEMWRLHNSNTKKGNAQASHILTLKICLLLMTQCIKVKRRCPQQMKDFQCEKASFTFKIY